MEKKLLYNTTFFDRLLSRGSPMPGVASVFLLTAVVSVLQIPATFFMKEVSWNLGIVVNEVVIIAGLPLIFSGIFEFDRKKIFLLSLPPARIIILSVLITLPTALLIDYATGASEFVFPLPEGYHQMMNALMSFVGAKEFLFKLFLLCVVPGVCEEIFFRGFCQTSLTASWGAKKSIIITAVIFAVLHGNPWYVHLYFLLGLFLSWIYAVTKSLWVPIMCHVINNAWTFINDAAGIKYSMHNMTDIFLVAAALVLMYLLAIKIKRSA